jgi:hypothetical protein
VIELNENLAGNILSGIVSYSAIIIAAYALITQAISENRYKIAVSGMHRFQYKFIATPLVLTVAMYFEITLFSSILFFNIMLIIFVIYNVVYLYFILQPILNRRKFLAVTFSTYFHKVLERECQSTDYLKDVVKLYHYYHGSEELLFSAHYLDDIRIIDDEKMLRVLLSKIKLINNEYESVLLLFVFSQIYADRFQSFRAEFSRLEIPLYTRIVFLLPKRKDGSIMPLDFDLRLILLRDVLRDAYMKKQESTVRTDIVISLLAHQLTNPDELELVYNAIQKLEKQDTLFFIVLYKALLAVDSKNVQERVKLYRKNNTSLDLLYKLYYAETE